jgi:single-stranded-DNA-specific exonuclease
MNRRWLIQRTNAEYVNYLSGAASISPALAQILINRDIKTPEDVSGFLSRAPQEISDPWGMGGIPEAVAAIKGALKNGTRVFVHGDYDVDGLTSTAMVVEGLRKLGLETVYFIPNRFTDGYGFNPPAVGMAREAGAGLILTVDCGISSFEAAEAAGAGGIGVIITDHHEPVIEPSTGRPLVPEALAVINPKLTNPELSDLAGAGVAFKLIQALAAEFPGSLAPEDYFDLAALGTIADSVPLLGENRTIVKEGLDAVFEGRRAGIRALNEVSGLNGRRARAGVLPYTLVPRMNAAGRLADAAEVVELMLSTSDGRAMEIASSLGRKNTERQRIEDIVLNEALGQMEGDYGHAIVLAGEGWHEGVIGIVAARIVERFYRPAFIFSIKGDTARGSARSIPEFDIYEGLTGCKDLLLAYGGHKQAAGLRIRTSELQAFGERISQVAASAVSDFTPTLKIDAAVDLREINFRLVEEIRGLEPFGCGNPEPLLGSRGLEVLYPRVVGNNHLKMKLRSQGYVIDSIGYNMGGLCGEMEEAGTVDAAYAANFNDWDGRRTLQLNLKALREAGGD